MNNSNNNSSVADLAEQVLFGGGGAGGGSSFLSRKEISSTSTTTCDECDEIAVVECAQCCLPFCATHDLERHSGKKSSTHVRFPITSGSNSRIASRFCAIHPGEVIRLYCPETTQLVCDLCAVVGNHRGKTCVLLEDACVMLRESVQSDRGRLQDALLERERVLLAIHQRETAVNESKDALAARVNTVVDNLRALLETRRNTMLSEIDSIAADKLEALGVQGDNTQRGIAVVRGALDAADTAMTLPFRRGNEFEFVSEALHAHAVCKELQPISRELAADAELGLELDGVYSDALADMLTRLVLRPTDVGFSPSKYHLYPSNNNNSNHYNTNNSSNILNSSSASTSVLASVMASNASSYHHPSLSKLVSSPVPPEIGNQNGNNTSSSTTTPLVLGGRNSSSSVRTSNQLFSPGVGGL